MNGEDLIQKNRKNSNQVENRNKIQK